MLIDSHQHVFWHGRDDAGLVADLDEFGKVILACMKLCNFMLAHNDDGGARPVPPP